jgi:hypothetical protein
MVTGAHPPLLLPPLPLPLPDEIPFQPLQPPLNLVLLIRTLRLPSQLTTIVSSSRGGGGGITTPAIRRRLFAPSPQQ